MGSYGSLLSLQKCFINLGFTDLFSLLMDGIQGVYTDSCNEMVDFRTWVVWDLFIMISLNCLIQRYDGSVVMEQTWLEEQDKNSSFFVLKENDLL